MEFDIHTLLVTAALVATFCAAARFQLWRMHPQVPGLGHWAAAGVLAACALFLFSGHRLLPEFLSLSLAQLMVAAGLLTAWDGFRRFLGRTPLSPIMVVGPLAALIAVIAIAQAQSSLLLRALANTGMVGLFSLMVAYELLRSDARSRPATRLTAYVYLVNAAFCLARALSVLVEGGAPTTATSAGMQAWILLWWLCFTIAATLGMALMTGERLQADLDRLASRDPLTGALNRRAFSQLAGKEVARAVRNQQPLTVMMMDLDHFKQINDRLGHAVGDDILRRFVKVANETLRGEDTFCRFGGEEFVALLPDASAKDAAIAAERLRLAFAQEAAALPRPPQAPAFTVSIGVAEMLEEEALEDALRRADAALYEAKAAGRNRSVTAPPRQQPAYAGVY